MKKRSPSRGTKAATKVAKFQVGGQVKAKWPGSNLYFDAEIVKVHRGRTISYTVQFEGDYQDTVPESNVQDPKVFRSRSSSPGRKPGGRRSRSRSPGRKRGRSPTRSPAKQQKSPARVTKREKKIEDTPPSSPEQTPRRSSRSRKSETVTVTSPQAQQEVVQKKTESVHFVRMTRSQARKLASTEEASVKTEPDKNPYQYGGPVVFFVMMHVLPLLMYCLYLFCNKNECAVRQYPKLPLLKEYFDMNSFLIILGFIHFIALLSVLPVGKVVAGALQTDGTAFKYRMNGFFSLVVSLGAAGLGFYYKKIPIDFVYDKFLALMTSSIILSFLVSIALYIKARVEKTDLAPDGNTESGFYNFCVGHQLNPRKFGIDLKYLFMRTAMIGWVLVNLCLAAKVYQKPSPLPAPVVMVGMFQLLQAADLMWFEEYLLYYPAISKDGFGFLNLFTLLSWIPFMNTNQMRYLVDHPVFLSNSTIVGIVAIQVLGYIIYRGSNSQKCRFKINPDHPEFTRAGVIQTSTGRKLLVCGCWGIVRHPNYLGDILMNVACALTCGFGHAIPYFNAVYITLMLLDRVHRTEADCSKRYGEGWHEFCQRVPYKILPKIY